MPQLKFNNINFSPVSGVSRLWCGEMLPPMLKSLSLSIDDGGDESILFAILPSSGNTFMFVFHQSIGATSRGSNCSEQYFSSSFLSAFEDAEDCRRSFFLFPFSAFVAFDSADAISHSNTCQSQKVGHSLQLPQTFWFSLVGSVSVEAELTFSWSLCIFLRVSVKRFWIEMRWVFEPSSELLKRLFLYLGSNMIAAIRSSFSSYLANLLSNDLEISLNKE